MLPAMTPAVARALEVAQRLAAARSETQIQPIDLLLALLNEEDGRAATLATTAGLASEALSAQQGEVPPTGDPVLLGVGAESILDVSREMAFDLSGERIVTSEALLLALLRRTPDVFADLLPHGLDPGRLEAELAGAPADNEPMDPGWDEVEPAFHLADMSEQMDAARLLDACANRAREALRIIEDYARFALDDAFLSRQCKQMRHDLTSALTEHGPDELLWARETQHDVGTAISTASEFHRESLPAVAAANLKRLQEALRSIEEFAKVSHPLLAQRVESLRYQSYTLERAVLIGVVARQQLRDVKLCALLSGSACQAALDWTIAEAVAGGVGMIQLREKTLPDKELIVRARQVRRWTRQEGVLLIINDRPDIARLVEADGVHLGQDDLPVKDARRLLGPTAIIGVSTHDIDQVRRAVLDGATYLGVGPVFSSQTKSFEALAGLAFVQAAMAETRLPAFAIGGINADTIDAAVAAGATRVAVSHAIVAADDPRQAAAMLRSALGG